MSPHAVKDSRRRRRSLSVSGCLIRGRDESAPICILRRLFYVPARRNGVNVESTVVSWPILVRPPA
jgi:hypothetical protein